MDEDLRGALETGAAQLAALTAGVHLYVGLPRFWLYWQAGTLWGRPRIVLFVLFGLGVLVGLSLWARGLRRDVVYAAGVALTLAPLVGWLLVGGHGPGLVTPAWVTQGHAHGTPLATLVDHAFGSWQLTVTKVTELLLLSVLSVLLYGELRGDGGE